MALKFKAGDSVVQVLPTPITGTISRFVFDETTGEISYVVTNVDADGEHERVFKEEDLKLAE